MFALIIAASVTLAWDTHPDPLVSAYTLYWGTGVREYPNAWTVDVPTTQTTATNLVSGTGYYFAVTARNWEGFESEFSEEVFYQVPATVTFTAVFEQSDSPAGPWQFLTNAFVVIAPAEPQKFYRVKMEVKQ